MVVTNVYDPKFKRVRVISENNEPSLTQQQFKDETDITRIVKRFGETGFIDHINTNPPRYDFATSQTFQEAQYLVAEATNAFNQLPSDTRAKYGNDPARWLDSLAEAPDEVPADVMPAAAVPSSESPESPPEDGSGVGTGSD